MEFAEPDEITAILKRCQDGDEAARNELFSAVNDRLRELAAGLMRSERAEHTLQATGLVNEACVRMLKQDGIDSIENRRHLFAAATLAMKNVLIDHARKRNTAKRGGDRQREALDVVLDRFEAEHGVDFTALEGALEKLKQHSERQHQVVTLRYFSGISLVDTAELLGCSKSTVESDWRWARAKLHRWLSEAD
ncbi:MAG: ECF-type sigma factor [Planctomycetaceae bacterium]